MSVSNDINHDAGFGAHEILKKVESKYYDKFLPCVYTKTYYQEIFKNNGENLRLWESSQGKAVIFHPPPPKIKENPAAKPERLGRVIKRLAWYYKKI